MGMHYGVVAAEMASTDLLAAFEPFEIGANLHTDCDTPFGDIDGLCIFAAFGSCGFDYWNWVERGTYEHVTYPIEAIGFSNQHGGELEAAISAHLKRHALKDSEVQPISIVGRDSDTGETISQTSTGVTLSGKTTNKGLLSRLRGKWFQS